jgi:16S rRNA (adenine1518-N6/adenine1519-N6)-dimethyltransferase
MQTRGLLRRFDLRAKKGLGQHFLVDEGVLQNIISAADLSPQDVVVEIGPGLGILTAEIAKQAGQVIAIELDSKLASILRRSLAHFPNLTVINADVLQLNISELIPDGSCYKVVANLPYYISAPILRRFLEAQAKPHRMVVMVQKEVAQSIAAAPGKMSILSIAVQLYGKPAIVAYVPAHSFYPQPKVDSAIVSIDVYEHPIVADTEGLFTVVRAGFSNPRKQLRNSLAQGLSLSPQGAVELLNRVGVSPSRRAQTLTIAEWTEIYQATEEQNADHSRLC